MKARPGDTIVTLPGGCGCVLAPATALFLLAISCGVRFLDCPETAVAGYEVAVEHFPSIALDFLDVRCEDQVYGDLDCVTWAMGKPGFRAKYEVEKDLAARCIIHEAQHSYLYHEFDDDCPDHLESCLWSYEAIDRANDELGFEEARKD